MNSSKVWYITGASQGLGLTLVKKLLAKGYRVAATSRTTDALNKAVDQYDKTRFLPIAVDLTKPDSVQESIEQTMATFGQIDVVVNNAGYGMVGTIEEIDKRDIQNIFNINVLAAIDVVKNVLPVMREQRAGYIINIGSVAGFVGAPGWSVYSATKAAIAAFSEVLALDLKEFGIKVTVVEPSGFRTGFLTKDSLVFTKSKISGYDAVKSTQESYIAADGKQPGDPDKAAEILIELSENAEPPLHLFLGADAVTRAAKKITNLLSEIEKWRSTSIEADFKDDF